MKHTTIGEPVSKEVLESDFEAASECSQNLTPRQMEAIKAMAYYRACKMRAENKWSPAEEAAYFNGVMCAFFATRCNVHIPAFWIMGQGRILDLLAKWKERGDRLVQYARRKKAA